MHIPVSKDPRLPAMQALKVAGKTYSEIGAAFGVSYQRIQQMFSGNSKAPPFATCERCRKFVRSPSRHHPDYRKLDEVELLCARCHTRWHSELSPRPKKALPPHLLALWDPSKTQSQLAALLNISSSSVAKYARRHNLKCAKYEHPTYAAMNWELPSSVLARVWDKHEPDICSHRVSHKKPKAKWDLLRLPHSKPKPAELLRLVEAEEEKRNRMLV